MENDTQISAVISRETRDLLERYVRETGIKRGHLIEVALRQYLQALEHLPRDVIVHSRIVVSKKSGAELLNERSTTYRRVFDLVRRLGTDLGCVGVMVDAKPGALGFYERYGFIRLKVVEGGFEARPRPIPLFISTRKIADACRA